MARPAAVAERQREDRAPRSTSASAYERPIDRAAIATGDRRPDRSAPNQQRRSKSAAPSLTYHVGRTTLIKDELSDQIVKAIAAASGAQLVETKKAKRAGVVPRERQNAERLKRTKQSRERRFAPFQALENHLSPNEASFGDELMEIVLRELLAKHGVPFTHEAAGAFYREHGAEVLSALKSTMSHTTVDNAVLAGC